MTQPLFFVGSRNYMKRDPSSGSASVAAPATSVGFGYYVTNYTVAHNLGYIPFFRAAYEPLKNGEIFSPIGVRGGGAPIDGTTSAYPALLCWPTTTTLTLQLFYSDNTLTGLYNIYWVIYQVKAL